MFTKSLLVGGALAIAASGASAFEFKSSEIHFGWDRIDSSAGDADGFNLGLDASAMASDTIELDFGLGYASPDNISGSGLDNLFRLSLAGNYLFSQGLYAGLFWDGTHFDSSGTFSGWAHVYGLQGGYKNGPVDVVAFYGVGDYSDIGAPSDSDSFGIDFTYTLQNGLDFGAYYLSEDLTTSSIDQYGVTVGYLVPSSQLSSVPVYIVGSFGRMKGATQSFDQFALGVSFPLSGDVKKGRKSFHGRSAFHNAFGIAGTLF
ncbi:hypothetical protein SAMN05444000_10160 [Shimia gijangensis]|uniref:Uncharacterized protein n=1 Tax=Shimia gijangensis TaxID=1470563 RepID=A0A1M6AW15_9RHOB|nr:hypothetical protein [Shimia gijangensis]SHI40630.1 hypothetical protein SAMN05444000_10160 [Shimia gijangensis]